MTTKSNEDTKAIAEIAQIRGATITNLVREGFTHQSAVAAVTENDMKLLRPSRKTP
jgi:hypothetical protein